MMHFKVILQTIPRDTIYNSIDVFYLSNNGKGVMELYRTIHTLYAFKYFPHFNNE